MSHLELPEGGWLDLDPAFLASDEADRVLAQVRDEIEWEQREVVIFGRRVLQPRLIGWAGEFGYRYSGQTLEPRAFTAEVAALLHRVQDRTGVAFNHVLANRYRNGNDTMGLHADDEPELGAEPVVATLSLGAARRFVLKPRRKPPGPAMPFDLGAGHLLVMGGRCQDRYVHGIPRQISVQHERISLTFRRLLRAPGQSDCQ